MHTKHISYTSDSRPGLLRKAVAVVAAAAIVFLGLMFSAILLSVLLIVGTVAFAYLWLKTRRLRKQMQAFSAREAAVAREEFGGVVIEGEAIRVDEAGDGARR